jgi:flagellar assembly factor FliW
MLTNDQLAETNIEAALDAPPAVGDTTFIASRFGHLEFNSENALTLPQGVLGFSGYHDFCVANLPDGKHPQFKVLQCLTEPDVAFLIVPFNIDSEAIDEADLDEACEGLSIERQDLVMFLIVTVRREGDNAAVSVNLRAPLFIDKGQQTGRQYVMPNNKYSIRHGL